MLEYVLPWVHGAQIRLDTVVASESTYSPGIQSTKDIQEGEFGRGEKSTSCVQESQILSSVIDGAKSTYSPGLQSET